MKDKDFIIAIDFDGTCVTHEYPEVGCDIGAYFILLALVEGGAKLVLNTMRSGKELEDAVKWFEDRGIKLHGVNETPGQKKWTSSPKVYAHIYVDDSTLGCPTTTDGMCERPYVKWADVGPMLFDLLEKWKGSNK